MSKGDSKYTPSGVRRAGDDYQDVVALDVLVSVLEHPDRYEWVRVEADDFGYLDDVVALRCDGTVEARQVKFAAHPENDDDVYDWDRLTTVRKGKRGGELPSLIGKWGKTVLQLLRDHETVDAALVTNRRAGPGLARCIDEGTERVCPERIPSEVMDELSRQVGSEADVIRFLGCFEFRMDRPGLDLWESRIRARFTALNSDFAAWSNLKDSLRTWVREKELPEVDGHIRPEHVRSAARWHRLEAMPQGFAVPADYVLPSASLHRNVLERLSDSAGTCLVATGTPGIGKSSYLSYVHQELRNQGRQSVRHHYFLSPSDTTVGRFEHENVIESLMADLRIVAGEALRAFDARNPKAGDFPQWLDACSQFYRSQPNPLVIMVDGLDHVWRDRRDVAQLTKLFENLLPCRPGICLAVGTQPLADEQLPKRLLDAAPREQWLDIPPLDRQAALQWTHKNESLLTFRAQTRPEDHESEIREISGAFFDVTQGHPLLLRYTINGLQEANQPINARNISMRGPCSGTSVDDYYRALWTGLGTDARFMLCVIAASGFEWPGNGIVECCGRSGINPIQAQQSWRHVMHMMCRVPLGWLQFHSSLGVFVAKTDEYRDFRAQVQRSIATWLETDAPEYWRWAYAWRLQADMGDFGPLLAGTSRAWVVDSLAKGYPHSQVCVLLEMAARQALVSRDFHAFGSKALLFDYVNDSYNLVNWESRDDWAYAQLACASAKRLPEILLGRKNEMNDGQLVVLAERLGTEGHTSGVAAILSELIDRFNTQGKMRRMPAQDWLSQLSPVIRTEALLETTQPATIAGRISRRRNEVDPVRFSRIYADALGTHRRAGLLKEMCDADLADAEREQFLERGFLLAREENLDWSDVARRHSQHIFAAIYARIMELTDFPALESPAPPLDILAESSFDFYGDRKGISPWLGNCFYWMVACQLWGKDDVVSSWLSRVGDYSWPREFIQCLAVAASRLATALLGKRDFSLTDFYGAFDELPRPDLRSRDGGAEFWQIARKALANLGLDSVALAADGRSPLRIGKEACSSAFNSTHCYWADWTHEYVRRRRPWLTDDAIEWILATCSDTSCYPLEEVAREGARESTVLAQLLALHRRQDEAIEFLRKSVDLTLTHGHHNDIVLDQYLEALQCVAEPTAEYAQTEIAPLVPAILHLSEITDGDETGHTTSRLFDTLVELRPEWLPSMYHYLCGKEKYYDAAEVFRRVVRSLSFSSPFEIALGSTCLDQEDQKELLVRAGAGAEGARQALNSVRALLGTSPFCGQKTSYAEHAQTHASSAEHALPDKEAFPPEHLLEYWQALRAVSYSKGADELRAWADFWGTRAGVGIVRDALIRLTEEGEFVECASLIHDLTVRELGRKDAWPWLVKAHCEVNGWSYRWTHQSLAEEKWQIVARHYPDRWVDFLAETMAMGKRSWEGIGVWGRLPRIAPYLLLLERDEEARSLLRGARETIGCLVSPFGLRSATWLADGKAQEQRLLDVLLARLTWPSGMVRERACTALAKLLDDEKCREDVSKGLLDWVRSQDLESVACLGLLPFIRAKQLNSTVQLPTPDQLRQACARPSLLFELLLKDLLPDAAECGASVGGHAGTAPSGYRPCAKFFEQCSRVLPQIYREQAEWFLTHCRMPFMRQWAYETDHVGKGLREADIPSASFWGRSDGEHYVAYDTPLSELFRSAYLRALAWLFEQSTEYRFYATAEAVRTLPIDLGLWQVAPRPAPDWWPVCQAPPDEELDTVPAQILKAIEDLWNHRRDTEWVVGAAGGRVAEGGTIYDLEIFGFFQQCMGPTTPSADDIFDAEPWVSSTVMLDPSSLRFCGIPIDSRSDRVDVILGDWLMVPCALPGHSHIVGCWQWWRFMRRVWLPLPTLTQPDDYQIRCGEDRLAVRTGEEEFAYWQDWTCGLTEKAEADLLPRTGNALMLKWSIIDRYAAENGLTFCWACRIKGHHRKYSGGDFKHVDVCKIFGANNLIFPD